MLLFHNRSRKIGDISNIFLLYILGVPLLFDLYEGCQKSFDMGPVKVGEKIVRQIEVMNHSKVPIDATFIFKDMYPVIDDTLQSEATSVCLSPSVANLTADPGPSRYVCGQKKFNGCGFRRKFLYPLSNVAKNIMIRETNCFEFHTYL